MFLHKYEMAVQRVLRFCAAKLTAPVVLHAHSNLSAQQPPTLYSPRRQLHRNLSLHPIFLYPLFISGPFCIWTDHSWLWVLSPLLPVFYFLFRIYMLHTHTQHTPPHHTHAHAHAHAHTHTQLPSKAMRLLGWCIVYYKVAGMERPDGSICMSVYEFHLGFIFLVVAGEC